MARKRKILLTPLLAALVLATAWASGSDADLIKRADAAFEKKNYLEAAEAYQAAIDAGTDAFRHAYERLILSHLRLEKFAPALAAAATHVERVQGTPFEARAERLLGNLYMTIPHWGTRAGGKFLRAQWGQGIQVLSGRHDKKRAVRHLVRARELYAHYDAEENAAALASLPEKEREGWRDERIGCLFDLSGTLARFGIYERDWSFWYWFWGERDDDAAETAGESDFDEYYRHWETRRKRPVGLRVGPDEAPIFPAEPESFGPERSDDENILFLLGEIRRLDRTGGRKHSALAWYRQAMLARSRFGMERMRGYTGIWWGDRGSTLTKDLERFSPWELGDSEAVVLAGGRYRKVVLPKQWDVLSLLRTVGGDLRESGFADRAEYAVGLYHQSRKQYGTAIGRYEALLAEYPKSRWRTAAERQIKGIRAGQVRIEQPGVQLPGEPAGLEVSHRNASKVWFTARRSDHEGYLRELRGREVDKHKGHPFRNVIRNWHRSFVQGYQPKNEAVTIAAQYVGEEVARWADEVPDDGSHRSARATLRTPLDRPGAFLVTAYLVEPEADHADAAGEAAMGFGTSRAVVVLSDLAIVEKKVEKGNLYFVADARTGAPVEGAKIEILELWSIWDQKLKVSEHFSEMHQAVTDEDGLAVFPIPKRRYGNLHVLAGAGEGEDRRLAWTGMNYWSGYRPSVLKNGRLAYVITDRPVYRPGQVVRFKVWRRRMKDGEFQDPDVRDGIGVDVYDPRGNVVHSSRGRTDEFESIDGEFRLGEEPPLGVYRIGVSAARYLGGQTFRVEEYKKPEFEVTVTPSETNAKLGGKLTAKIRAEYYFGGPVKEATVKYRVFREEYRHRAYFPGRWDWLYGPGYGLAWYSYPWFGWWHVVTRSRVEPDWWWGFRGYAARPPIRELVQEGDAPIGEDGTLDVSIDTAPALRDHGDRDHRYVITAEVRDASRRVITGEGAVKVTRQAFYALLRADRGYARPGQETVVRLRCVTPENLPVRTAGVMTVSEVSYGGMGNKEIAEREIARWTTETDERGRLEVRLRHEKSGLLRIAFEAPDEWGGVVRGSGLVWYCGSDFDGRFYRFNDLELITDKRTYAPGETAHVMINTKRAESHVLFADEVDGNHLLSWRMLRIENGHAIVDVPIRKGHRPNFFLEATTVSDTRVHQQVKRICVPPEKGVIDVEVRADKAEYGPGEKAEVEVLTTGPDGNPVKAQVALAAFDRSVLYIQPETAPPIAKFFHGQLRRHRARMTTNLVERFSAWGTVVEPSLALRPFPPSWWGLWGPQVRDWRTVTADFLVDMAKSSPVRGYALGIGGGGRGAFAANGAGDRTMDVGGAARAPASGPVGGLRRLGEEAKPAEPGAGFASAEVRKRFADTALWAPAVTTDEDGRAKVSFEMPENLTTWKINAWAMTKGTKVGQADTSAITTKDLLVRLQAPRFFMEYDEVVLSANVHNYLATAKTARVSIELPEKLLAATGETTVSVEVPAGGERRVDWRVRVLAEGTAAITVKALTDEESDAMRMTFPVLVHGMTKQVSATASMRPDEEKTLTLSFEVPEERRPELTRLEVRFAPSLVGAMLDALPYCLYYPYGCTEQTMSRFLPAVRTRKTLQQMGIKLEDVKALRSRMREEVRRIEKGERRKIYSTYRDSPIFDDDELSRIIEKSLSRIGNMQNGDGGWGWWAKNESNTYLTAYVLYALLTARECDVAVDAKMIRRGVRWLEGRVKNDLVAGHWKPSSWNVFAAYVLSMEKRRVEIEPAKGDERPGDLVERLWLGRDELPLYGKALLAMTHVRLDEKERAKTVVENIMQWKEENPETEVAWFRTPRSGWWYWWNNDIETNAWILRAIVAVDPKSDVAPKVVKWLLGNRRNGYYWRSTRDTTLCLDAMSEFVKATGEADPDYTLRLDLDDGAVVKEVKIDRGNFFTFDNRFVVEGVALGAGKHTLRVTKQGTGALYLNSRLSYFTKERHITAAGHELKVERTYHRLERIPHEVAVEDSAGGEVREKRLRYRRVPIADGDTLKSGDVIQVELKVVSDNDYTYLAFEDMLPAGCEPIQVRSGGKGQEGFLSYMELRDEKVVFFVGALGRGEHLLRYRLRAEIPGEFHALPARLYAMYAPELRANSEEIRILIVD